MNDVEREKTENYIREMVHGNLNTRFAVKCDKKQLEKIKKLFHEKKPYGVKTADFLIKLLEGVK